MSKFDNTIIDLIESTTKNFKALPLNLGAVQGSGGGIGSPPGGYIGWLPQGRVAYDLDEAATLVTSVSGSILDNLNHIRYRLQQIEAGSGVLVVDEYGGSPSVSPATRISFSGGIVTDLGGGHALVTVSGGGGLDTAAGDARYLKLDASNDPLTAQLDITPSTPGDGGIYISTAGDAFSLDVEQLTTNTNVTSPNTLLIQYTDGTGSFNNNSQLIHGLRYKLGAGNYSSSWITLETAGSGTAFEVDNGGNINIPSASRYKINGVSIIDPPTSAIGVALTDNTAGGGTTDIINAINAATVDTSAAKLTDVRDALHQLTIKVNKIHDWAVSMGLEDV